MQKISELGALCNISNEELLEMFEIIIKEND